MPPMDLSVLEAAMFPLVWVGIMLPCCQLCCLKNYWFSLLIAQIFNFYRKIYIYIFLDFKLFIIFQVVTVRNFYWYFFK